MQKYHIELTKDELALLEAIDLREYHSNHEEARKAYLANQTPILNLIESLTARDAIPQERLRYWNDPEYNTGRVKASRMGSFERSGNVGGGVYTHPHFKKYLRYFLFGADLPDEVIVAFEEKVGNPEWVTSGDIDSIAKCARDLTRKHALDSSEAQDEFFKLCLDMGLGVNVASTVMRAVKSAR